MSLTQALYGLGLYFLSVFGIGLIWAKRERKTARKRKATPEFYGGGYGTVRSDYENKVEEHLSPIG